MSTVGLSSFRSGSGRSPAQHAYPVAVEWIWWVIVPVAVVAVCVVGQFAGFMDFTMKGKDWKRSSGNIMGPIDGLFAPNRQEALQEQERQTELPAPAPAPGDPLLDLDKGIARIDLSSTRSE
jgi:hypothetical protein